MTFTPLPVQGVPVRSLLREPGSHIPQGQKAKNIKQRTMVIIKALKKKKKLFGEGNGNPPQYSCLGDLTDGGAWQAIMHGIAKGSNTV